MTEKTSSQLPRLLKSVKGEKEPPLRTVERATRCDPDRFSSALLGFGPTLLCVSAPEIPKERENKH